VVRSSKLKRDSLRSRWTGRVTKDNRVLVAVAVAAVSLLVVAIMLLRSSKDDHPASQQETLQTNNGPVPTKDERPASQQGTLQTNNVPVPPAGGADVRRASLVIESPKEGATVGMREDLTGRIESEGWPVFFVQALIPGQPWWCQAPVARVDGGRFSTQVVFGDEFTPSGTRFRIAGLVARTREAALKFEIGSKEQALPQGLPRSAEVVVTHR
jgi:hypothetical protein